MAKKQYNAFSIIELLVAIGLLVILAGLSSVVFSTTVKAHRKATASIEVARNLRVLSDQLTSDLRGLRKDAPLMLRFSAAGTDEDGSGTIEPDEYAYYDMLHFFADGDFQTTRQYSDGTEVKTISGNIARVYYGHANSVDQIANPGTEDFDIYHVLARKTHILTADAGIAAIYGQIPLISNGALVDYTQFATSFGQSSFSTNYLDENELEFSTITLAQWLAALNYVDGSGPTYTDNADAFLNRCMADVSRPFIDLSQMQTLHLLMAQGVIDFQVQWAYTPADLAGSMAGFTTGVRWWPSVDPNGDGNPTDSDFAGMNGGNPFGVYFTLPGGESRPDWVPIQSCRTRGVAFSNTFYPKALKFTFTLRDLNGIFEEGKTFTHIVYIDN